MNLFDSFQIRDISFRNRIAVSSMCEYSSEDGFANDWHLVHLGARAVGGAGTVLTEATAVVSEGRISPSDLGIWKDAHVENLARVVRFHRDHSAVAGTQLAHAGFKASTGAPWRNHGDPVPIADGGWRPIYSSTAKGFTPESIQPEALTLEGIARIAHAFAEGARRSLEAGFELVEIHGAHGYLVHQFLSPLVNTRTDQYGGSFENRTRILREIIAAVRQVWPECLPLWLRISASETGPRAAGPLRIPLPSPGRLSRSASILSTHPREALFPGQRFLSVPAITLLFPSASAATRASSREPSA